MNESASLLASIVLCAGLVPRSDSSCCAAPQGNLWNVSNGVRVDW